MKKLVAVFATIILLLCSCSTLDAVDVSGEDNKTAFSRTDGDTLYVANTNSKTYHLPSCYIVKNMKAENKYETKDLDFLLERKFEPCKRCLKTEE